MLAGTQGARLRLRQVVALLRQRQRVTYRALKVQFKLDDETLKALKEERL
jgi:hypothetical protein